MTVIPLIHISGTTGVIKAGNEIERQTLALPGTTEASVIKRG
jgi:hypothetical protein